MDSKNISTKLGAIILVIFTLTALAFVLAYEKSRPISQIENNLPAVIKNNPSENKTGNEPINQVAEETINTLEEDLKNYPPMEPDEVTRLTNLTKTWKTFRNEEQGYEFKYPLNYHVSATVDNIAGYRTVKIISNEKYYGIDGGCPNPPCEKTKIPNEITIESVNASFESIKDSLKGGEWDRSSAKNILLNNHPAFYYEGGVPTLNIIIKNKDKVFYINMQLFSQFKDVFQGIYFTFKEIN